jgi:hypothetical protein
VNENNLLRSSTITSSIQLVTPAIQGAPTTADKIKDGQFYRKDSAKCARSDLTLGADMVACFVPDRLVEWKCCDFRDTRLFEIVFSEPVEITGARVLGGSGFTLGTNMVIQSWDGNQWVERLCSEPTDARCGGTGAGISIVFQQSYSMSCTADNAPSPCSMSYFGGMRRRGLYPYNKSDLIPTVQFTRSTDADDETYTGYP